MSHCELITDDGIRQLAAGSCAAESLSVLELDNCPLITDQTLEHLVSCHNLQRIELYDCQMITRAAIRRLRVNAPKRISFVSYFNIILFYHLSINNAVYIIDIHRITFQISKCMHILLQSLHHQPHPVHGPDIVAAVRYSEKRPLVWPEKYCVEIMKITMAICKFVLFQSIEFWFRFFFFFWF